jgi:hypothetical protein
MGVLNDNGLLERGGRFGELASARFENQDEAENTMITAMNTRTLA